MTKKTKTTAPKVSKVPSKSVKDNPPTKGWIFGDSLSLREDAERRSRYATGMYLGAQGIGF